jgi:hypothetical protein
MFDPNKDYKSEEKDTFTVVPEGVYDVEVSAMNLYDGKSAPYYRVDLRVTSGEHKGASIREIISTGQKSWWKLAEFCQACDIKTKFDPVGESGKFIQMASGCTVSVDTRIEEYNGSERARVDKFHRPENQQIEFDEDDDMLEEVPF